jgi:hypothetical protein
MELLVLLILTLPFILVFLVFQSLIVLLNSDEFKVSTSEQTTPIKLKLIKILKKEEINPLSITALSSPMTIPLLFIWPKDESFALVFENNVSIAVKEQDLNNYQLGNLYTIEKIVTRSFYKRRWFEKPILFNLFLQQDEFKSEYETTTIKHRLV